jgi:opacity protein-like surface antigen
LPSPLFFYDTELKSKGGFVNLWLDMPVQEIPLTLFVGGGLGAFEHEVSVNDTVVAGNSSQTEFAFHLGAGAKLEVLPGVEIITGLRYMDLGETTTSLEFLGVSAREITHDHSALEGRIGLSIALSSFRGEGTSVRGLK